MTKHRFAIENKVRFADVDPAGIVFYPRYFEMINAAVEDWFEQCGMDFDTMHRKVGLGVPTVDLKARFIAPSELGEILTIAIDVEDLSRSSCRIKVEFTCQGQQRLVAEVVLVCMDLAARRSTPWPDDLRAAMAGDAGG